MDGQVALWSARAGAFDSATFYYGDLSPPALGGGAEAWPQVHPASCAGHARRQACERLSAGWRVPAEPTMLRLNSHFLGL